MKKIISIVLGSGLVVALALTMLVGVPQAKASDTPNLTVAQNLTIGSTGQEVFALQSILSELGFLNIPISTPFGYFGPLTRDAVARYQASLGVSPTAGYFGPATKIAMHTQFAAHGWLTLLGW
jgi:peptidoglycan hydrolase-like protein with peptidoglycan-binding domain